MLSGIGYDVRRNDIDYALLKKLLEQRSRMIDYLWADYYPLTSWSFENDVWMAWQFDRPEDGSGIIQAFRRPGSPYEMARLKLRGLDPRAAYRIRDMDVEGEKRFSGRELLEKGLPVSITQQRGAVILMYDRADARP
jgi:alpha-galactosidase